jgi:hypothetical protein
MAITLHTAGSWVAANATTQTVTLPTHSTGDMLLVRVGFKHATMPTTVTCDTAGWAKVATEVNGTGGASSNGGGGVEVCAFWKEAASAAETNPVITFDGATAATPSAAVANSYSKGAGELWATPVGDGAAVAAATSISATIASHVSATSGDLIEVAIVTNDNTTLTVPTFTQAGLTLAAVVESPAAALSSTTSNDIAADGCYRISTAGTSSAAAVVTGTNSVADLGAAWTTRLRVTVATDAAAEVAPATAAANAATTTVQTTAGVASATATAMDASVLTSKDVDAGLASAIATANAASESVAPTPGVATATAAASQAAPGVSPSAGAASALATALDATVETPTGTDADAEVASVAAAANQPSVGVSPSAAAAAAIAAAYSPDASLLVNAGRAQATASAYNATVSTATFVDANAESAAAIAAAYGTDATVAPTAGRGAVAATAHNATTTSTGPINVNAGLASASATAYGATVKQPTKRQIQRFQHVNAYARLAQATARVPDATVEWNDDEAAIALLI